MRNNNINIRLKVLGKGVPLSWCMFLDFPIRFSIKATWCLRSWLHFGSGSETSFIQWPNGLRRLTDDESRRTFRKVVWFLKKNEENVQEHQLTKSYNSIRTESGEKMIPHKGWETAPQALLQNEQMSVPLILQVPRPHSKFCRPTRRETPETSSTWHINYNEFPKFLASSSRRFSWGSVSTFGSQQGTKRLYKSGSMLFSPE
jgi:hypothetical protein